MLGGATSQGGGEAHTNKIKIGSLDIKSSKSSETFDHESHSPVGLVHFLPFKKKFIFAVPHSTPQSPEAVSAVGKLSYNQLVEKIITCKHSSDSNLVTEGNGDSPFPCRSLMEGGTVE